jgi:hypothetical protein
MQSRKNTVVDYDTTTEPTPAPFGRNGATAFSRQPTHQEIARRAYEIYKSGKGGSQTENWFRAERELCNEAA